MFNLHQPCSQTCYLPANILLRVSWATWPAVLSDKILLVILVISELQGWLIIIDQCRLLLVIQTHSEAA